MVSTRVLSPGQAVVWAAFFNFVAAFVFGTAVAKTVGSGMVDINIVTTSVILAGLIGAIVWDLITWYYGLPTSSSHALIGGYAGAAVAKVGMVALIPSGWTKTLIFIVLAPMIGLVARLHVHGGDLWIVPQLRAVEGRSPLPQAAVAVGRGVQPRPRRQRRAEDDGHHRRRAVCRGLLCRSSRFRSGS